MQRVSRISRCALLVALTVLASGSIASGQGFVTLNSKAVGYVPLPGASTTKGLWAYEAGGKRYCLQTLGTGGLGIIDTTDTSNPVLVRTVPGNFRKVQVWQNYAYCTTDSGPTQIIDLTNPQQAQIVKTMSTGAHTLRIDQSNGRMYFNRSSALYIYDLTADPENPNQLGIWIGGAHDCRPVGDIVYANGFTSNPTSILDVSDPANVTVLGTVPNGNHSSDLYVAPTGNKVLITCDEQSSGHVKLFDVDNPADVTALGSYMTEPGTSVHNIEIRGAYAYIAYYQDQLRILDLRDPSNPVEVGIWDNNRLNTGSTYSDAWESIPDHDAVYMNQMYDTSYGNKGTFIIDFFPGFGLGSDGTGGQKPEAWWSFGPPSPGNDRFALRLTNALPNTPAYLIIGYSNTQWGALPLPATMDLIGAPNATLYSSADILIQTTTDAQGNASVLLPIPAGLPYNTFYTQWAVKDPGAPNPGGWAFTKGGELVIY
jgi:hypothetical protein